ncbi:PAS domain S-box protein [Colwellia sp. MEBiC06753]
MVGAGIGTMHYVGMAAMTMAPLLRYDLWMFALSILVAVSLAMLALWVRVGLVTLTKAALKEWHINITASVVMGAAISGMHYTGMAAARFVKPPGLELSQQTSSISFYLALGVAITTVVIICLVLGVNLIYRYKDASQSASESEQRLRAMMDTAVDAIVSIDSKGTIISVNNATENLFGWSAEQMVGNNVSMLIPEPDKSEHDGYISRFITTGDARIIGQGREVEAVDKNGEKVAIRLAIGHVKMTSDDFFVAFISDIRPRLKMEEALRANKEKFRSLITNIPGIAYRCIDDNGWPMIFISDAVETITGYPAQDFVLPNPKRSFTELFHPDDREMIAQATSTEEAFSLEFRIIRRDGQVRWMMEYGNYIKDQQSGDVWLDGFIMDITERREMELQLLEAKETAEQAASARAAFMANMSHEIRTPMNAIIGFSDILLENHLNDDEHRHLKTINQSAKSLLHLLNDVLDSAKLDKGKMELELRNFSLVEEVDAVVSTLWLQARNKGLQLTAEISPKLKDQYLGSPERIRQVLTNLLNNAIKFTQQGSVTLSVQPIVDDNIDHAIEFDALTSVRPYKAAWSIEQTMAFVKEQSGRHFEPKLVELLEAELATILEIKQRYLDE